MREDGKPETLDVLQAWARGESPHMLWSQWQKVTHKLSLDLAKRGLIEFGVSTYWCWITPEGREHLEKLGLVSVS